MTSVNGRPKLQIAQTLPVSRHVLAFAYKEVDVFCSSRRHIQTHALFTTTGYLQDRKLMCLPNQAERFQEASSMSQRYFCHFKPDQLTLKNMLILCSHATMLNAPKHTCPNALPYLPASKPPPHQRRPVHQQSSVHS